MNFGEALQALKDGKKVARAIWKGHWELAKDAKTEWEPRNDGYVRSCEFKAIIVAVLKDNGGVAPAQPYQQDLLAEDWQIVE